MNIGVIGKEELGQYAHLVLPYVCDELAAYEGDPEREYICLYGSIENEDSILFPVSALVMLMEPDGALSLLSVYTLPEYRRRGFASELLDKAVFIARRLFIFDEGEDEEVISVKAVYRLSPARLDVFEAFLKKNDFTDFYLLNDDGELKTWAAISDVRFSKTSLNRL